MNITERTNVFLDFLKEDPVEFIRLSGHFALSLPSHFNLLNEMGCKANKAFENLNPYFELYRLTQSFQKYFDSLGELNDLTLVNFQENGLLNDTIVLLADTLEVVVLFSIKFLLISTPTIEIVRSISSFLCLFDGISCMPDAIYSCASSGKNEDFIKFINISNSIVYNLVTLCSQVVEITAKETVLLTCGSIFHAVKVAQFVLEYQCFNGGNDHGV